MSDSESSIQKLIRLKRYEAPREGYFEDFLEEFQDRRTREIAGAPSINSSFSRIKKWLKGTNSGTWVMGAGVAYAAVMIAIFTWPKNPETQHDQNRQPVIFEPNPPAPNPVIPPKNPDPKVGF